MGRIEFLFLISLSFIGCNVEGRRTYGEKRSNYGINNSEVLFNGKPIGLLHYKSQLRVPILLAGSTVAGAKKGPCFWLPPVMSYIAQSAKLKMNPFTGKPMFSFSIKVSSEKMLESANKLIKARFGSEANIATLPINRFRLKSLKYVGERFEVDKFWNTRERFEDTVTFTMDCRRNDTCKNLVETIKDFDLIKNSFGVETVVDNEVGKLDVDDRYQSRLSWRIGNDISNIEENSGGTSTIIINGTLTSLPITTSSSSSIQITTPTPSSPAISSTAKKPSTTHKPAEWFVFQNRSATHDGSHNMNKNWTSYKNGFGNYNGGQFWRGLETVHQMTIKYRYKLRLEFTMHNGTEGWSEHNDFNLSSEADRYRFHVGGFIGGSHGNPLYQKCGSAHVGNTVGNQFATYDKDIRSYTSTPKPGTCKYAEPNKGTASNSKGGWWYCYSHWTDFNRGGSNQAYLYTCISNHRHGFPLRATLMMMKKY